MTRWFGIDGVGGKMFPYLGGNGVIRIPYAVLVGKDGLVAHHGYLRDMLAEARKLAKAPGGGETPTPATHAHPGRRPAARRVDRGLRKEERGERSGAEGVVLVRGKTTTRVQFDLAVVYYLFFASQKPVAQEIVDEIFDKYRGRNG